MKKKKHFEKKRNAFRKQRENKTFRKKRKTKTSNKKNKKSKPFENHGKNDNNEHIEPNR